MNLTAGNYDPAFVELQIGSTLALHLPGLRLAVAEEDLEFETDRAI